MVGRGGGGGGLGFQTVANMIDACPQGVCCGALPRSRIATCTRTDAAPVIPHHPSQAQAYTYNFIDNAVGSTYLYFSFILKDSQDKRARVRTPARAHTHTHTRTQRERDGGRGGEKGGGSVHPVLVEM